MERKTYEITELAGTHVAGRRIQDRKEPLLLTEEEARLELIAGTIRPVPPAGGKSAGKELVGIPGAPPGTVGEAALGEADAPAAKPALSAAKPRSKSS
jgi:hypothetical protein